MAELAARIIGPKCSLPVVVLIHLDGGGGRRMEQVFPLGIRRLHPRTLCRRPFETETCDVRGRLNDDQEKFSEEFCGEKIENAF